MVARLESHIQGRSPGRFSSLGEREELGMRCPCSMVCPLPHHHSRRVDEDGANLRIGVGSMGSSERESAPHVWGVAHLACATIDAVGRTLLLLGELFHFHRDRRRLPLSGDLSHVGRRYTQGE